MNALARPAIHIRGWLVAVGLGLLAGNLVGLGATAGYTHAWWPALAGIAVGLAGCVAAPARQVAVALCGATVAVVTAVVTMVAVHFQSGFWPITNEVRFAQYGSATQAIMRVTVILGVQIGVPCLLAAVLVVATKRRYGPAAQQAPGAYEPRGNH